MSSIDFHCEGLCFPKNDDEKQFRAFLRSSLSSRKVLFISCLLTIVWCSQVVNHVTVIHDNSTQPFFPTHLPNSRGLYVAISSSWILHLPVIAIIPREYTRLRGILQISMYCCTLMYVVVVQGIMRLDLELVHDIWVMMALVGCLHLTFKQMVPIFSHLFEVLLKIPPKFSVV